MELRWWIEGTEISRLSRAEIVLPPQDTIDQLAARIERAFNLRCRPWYAGCSTRRVWAAAAYALWDAAWRNPQVPLDPELYVASLLVRGRPSDPWSCLTGQIAARRYERRVHRIIRRLSRELRREVDRAEELLRLGHGLTKFIDAPGPRFSPLGLYITAYRAKRPDLAGRLRQRVLAQHGSCPLYRQACRPLLSSEVYPIEDRWNSRYASATPSIPDQLVPFN